MQHTSRPLIHSLRSLAMSLLIVGAVSPALAQSGGSPEGEGGGGTPPDIEPDPNRCVTYEFESYSTTSVVFEGGDASKVIKFHPERGTDPFVNDLISWFSGFIDICNFMKQLKDLGREQQCGGCDALVNQCRSQLLGSKDYFGTPLDFDGMCWTAIADQRQHKSWPACVKYAIGEALAGGGTSAGYVPENVTASDGTHANYWNWGGNVTGLPDWLKDALRQTDFGSTSFPLDVPFTRLVFYIEPFTKPDGTKSMKVSPYPLTAGKLCKFGASAVDGTPISLIMDEEAFAKAEAKVVKFSLDSKKPNNWSLWRGSKAAPLLVRLKDDEKSVTSAEQLFGSSTRSSVIGVGSNASFSDGYAALAELDKNQDGRVSGSETLELGLWFDENEDGAATPGEVKFLGDVGIHTVHYQNPTRTANGDLEMKIGFERLFNGKNVIGRSVDWHLPTAETPELLLTAMQARDAGAEFVHAVSHDEGSLNAPIPPVSEKGTKKKDDTAKNKKSKPLPTLQDAKSAGKLSGLWKFSLDGKDSPSGFLVLSPDYEKGRIHGISFVVTPDPQDPKSPNRLLQGFELRGSMKDGESNGTWVLPGHNGSLVKTQFEIRDGKMFGTSKGSFNSNGQEERVQYSWTAEKVTK